MEVSGKTVVVTGGAQGIGAALAKAFEEQGATVWILDIGDGPASGNFLTCDVTDASALRAALDHVQTHAGFVDIFVSNAGVMSRNTGDLATLPVDDWERCWSVNVMAHVHAAHALLPDMIARRSGYFVIVASAAGLLNQIGDAAYSATKHAAVSFADSLAIDHGDDGIGVSIVCPQYVATPLIGLEPRDADNAPVLLTADDVAACVLRSVAKEEFLVLPHPEVRGYTELRAHDHDKWIRGMRKLRRRAQDQFGRVAPEDFYKLV